DLGVPRESESYMSLLPDPTHAGKRSMLLGIDIGTTSTKAILASSDGVIVAEASAESSLRSPHPGWAEEDPAQWWANVGIVCRRLLDTVPDATIAAVGVSGMVPTI